MNHHSSFVIRHSSFVIRHSSFVIHHSSFIIHHSSSSSSSSPTTIREPPFHQGTFQRFPLCSRKCNAHGYGISGCEYDELEPESSGFDGMTRYHLMEKHLSKQLIFGKYPIIYRLFYILGGCLEFLPSTVRRDV